ncbi:hypothetical protein L208DRAFT_1394788 [Tricholoma matsutake]|nr:hypothetical protein L208DRAFT_1394788 [Tricholoma matsutake 945]
MFFKPIIPQNAPLTVTYTRPGYSATTDTEEQPEGHPRIGAPNKRSGSGARIRCLSKCELLANLRMVIERIPDDIIRHRPLLSIACFLLEKIQKSQSIQMLTIGKIC